MEIIKIFIFFSLFFFLRLYDVFKILVTYYYLLYLRDNRHLIGENILIFLLINYFDFLIMNLKFLFFYLCKFKYSLYLIKKLNDLNDYYLEQRNVILIFLTNKILFFALNKVLTSNENKVFNSNEFSKKKNITKIRNSTDALNFLNSLKNKAN